MDTPTGVHQDTGTRQKERRGLMIDSILQQHSDALNRMMIGLLLFRLGGEQRFTMDEIDDIRTLIGGVQIYVEPDGSAVILRAKTPEQTLNAMEDGYVY
jgi:hypothetical protein